MFGAVLFGAVLTMMGALYVVFAFRSPPAAVEHWFRVPAVFVFFPAESRVKLGRITLGVALLLTGAGALLGSLRDLLFQ
jgi:hypothetical protein